MLFALYFEAHTRLVNTFTQSPGLNNNNSHLFTTPQSPVTRPTTSPRYNVLRLAARPQCAIAATVQRDELVIQGTGTS